MALICAINEDNVVVQLFTTELSAKRWATKNNVPFLGELINKTTVDIVFKKGVKSIFSAGVYDHKEVWEEHYIEAVPVTLTDDVKQQVQEILG